MQLSTGEMAVVIWFGVSAAAALFGELGFDIWLRMKGVRYRTLKDHNIGFRSRSYIEWCIDHGRDPSRGFLVLRAIVVLGVVPAALALVLVLI